MTTDIKSGKPGVEREGEGRANKKNVARGYMGSILGAT